MDVLGELDTAGAVGSFSQEATFGVDVLLFRGKQYTFGVVGLVHIVQCQK